MILSHTCWCSRILSSACYGRTCSPDAMADLIGSRLESRPTTDKRFPLTFSTLRPLTRPGSKYSSLSFNSKRGKGDRVKRNGTENCSGGGGNGAQPTRCAPPAESDARTVRRSVRRSVRRREGGHFSQRGEGGERERSRFDLSFVMQKSRISLELEEKGRGRGGAGRKAARKEGRKERAEDAADAAAAVKNEDVSDL